ncbi:MAG TPA: sigma factor-like helix-turn-helix DNA-binding protein [Acidimicrobiales bacterium]|nr:sigma factor-like helix-turn-helix DNA-binding protein [Acidimicrobiales bacterium]
MVQSTTVDAGPLADRPAYADLLERRFAALSATERDVLARRFLADEPETLEAIGLSHTLTRERVRQIESRALDRLADPRDQRGNLERSGHSVAESGRSVQRSETLNSENDVVEQALSDLRGLPLPVTEGAFVEMGFEPFASLPTRLLFALARRDHATRDQKLKVCQHNGRCWLVAGSHVPTNLALALTSEVREDGVVQDLIALWSDVEQRVRVHAGSDEEAADIAAEFIDALGLVEVGDNYAVLVGGGGVTETLKRVLRANGRAMERDELLNYCPGRSRGTVINALGGLPFVRAGRSSFGLEEWGSKPHPQLRDLVYAELAGHGQVAVAYLEKLAEAYDYKRSSIGFYAALPDVVEEDGVLRRRHPDDPPRLVEPGLDEKCMRVAEGPNRGRWACILDVNHKRLYHGPQFIRRPLAELLEIDPGTSGAAVRVNGLAVRASWRQDPYLFGGDLRPVLDKLGFADGERVRMIVAGPREVLVESLPEGEALGSYASLIVGLALYDAAADPLPVAELPTAVAYAIGLDPSTPLPVVHRRLLSRRNRDLSEALCDIFPEALEQ